MGARLAARLNGRTLSGDAKGSQLLEATPDNIGIGQYLISDGEQLFSAIKLRGGTVPWRYARQAAGGAADGGNGLPRPTARG